MKMMLLMLLMMMMMMMIMMSMDSNHQKTVCHESGFDWRLYKHFNQSINQNHK